MRFSRNKNGFNGLITTKRLLEVYLFVVGEMALVFKGTAENEVTHELEGFMSMLKLALHITTLYRNGLNINLNILR